MEPRKPTILVVDDDQGVRDTLGLILKKRFHLITAADGESALELLKTHTVDVVLLDIRLPGIDGLEVLKRIKESYDSIEVIMITVVRDIETAVRAIKLGAYDYMTKEFKYDAVENLIHRVLEKQSLLRKINYLSAEIAELTEEEFIIGHGSEMNRVREVVEKVAELPTTVLISGESGTGKELVARMIHRESDRCEKPFVTVNMAAVPEHLAESTLFGHERGAFTGAYKRHIGRFELAHEGTLFLDEVGDLDLNLQPKILRVIQEGELERVGGAGTIPIDVRLVTATRIDLEKAVEEGRFREDLFYRLNVIPIPLPPLRDRLQDIPLLVELFVNRYNKRFHKQIERMDEDALQAMASYPWPGNIRELENMVERLVALAEGPVLRASDIPLDLSVLAGHTVSKDGVPLNKARDAFEKSYIIRALERCGGKRAEAARALGISLSTLKYKMTNLGLYDVVKKGRKPGKPPAEEGQ